MHHAVTKDWLRASACYPVLPLHSTLNSQVSRTWNSRIRLIFLNSWLSGRMIDENNTLPLIRHVTEPVNIHNLPLSLSVCQSFCWSHETCELLSRWMRPAKRASSWRSVMFWLKSFSNGGRSLATRSKRGRWGEQTQQMLSIFLFFLMLSHFYFIFKEFDHEWVEGSLEDRHSHLSKQWHNFH